MKSLPLALSAESRPQMSVPCCVHVHVTHCPARTHTHTPTHAARTFHAKKAKLAKKMFSKHVCACVLCNLKRLVLGCHVARSKYKSLQFKIYWGTLSPSVCLTCIGNEWMQKNHKRPPPQSAVASKTVTQRSSAADRRSDGGDLILKFLSFA